MWVDSVHPPPNYWNAYVTPVRRILCSSLVFCWLISDFCIQHQSILQSVDIAATNTADYIDRCSVVDIMRAYNFHDIFRDDRLHRLASRLIACYNNISSPCLFCNFCQNVVTRGIACVLLCLKAPRHILLMASCSLVCATLIKVTIWNLKFWDEWKSFVCYNSFLICVFLSS